MKYENAETAVENRNLDGISQLYIAANKLEGAYYDEHVHNILLSQYKNDEKKVFEYVAYAKESVEKKIEMIKQHGDVTVCYMDGKKTILEELLRIDWQPLLRC